ncbi:helix-turn-helix transcriptional regulator [Streptomyces sp. BE20]|uniref:helix-turn-helix transcriptional regulator n=1 Tax=Streptomyces sp. BE20 TaxID=3002525 RepID=UPI002E767A2D|nr:helix-turn-helix transcriptional regulator [Streptomyces sp. BE20]
MGPPQPSRGRPDLPGEPVRVQARRRPAHPITLNARRKALDLTVAEVADRVGVHLATVDAWEAEDKTPTPARYLTWCNALGLTYRDVVNHEAWEANPDAEFLFLSTLLRLRRAGDQYFMSGEARFFLLRGVIAAQHRCAWAWTNPHVHSVTPIHPQ